jgi:hypothetical protein
MQHLAQAMASSHGKEHMRKRPRVATFAIALGTFEGCVSVIKLHLTLDVDSRDRADSATH